MSVLERFHEYRRRRKLYKIAKGLVHTTVQVTTPEGGFDAHLWGAGEDDITLIHSSRGTNTREGLAFKTLSWEEVKGISPRTVELSAEEYRAL